MSDNLKDIVLKAAYEDKGKNKLTCKSAHDILHEHGFKLADIGDFCNENDIHISLCQLGCFK